MARDGEQGEFLAELNRLRAENADLRRQVADLQRHIAVSGQDSERRQSEQRRWRVRAAHALTMDDPEYIRVALEQLQKLA